MSKRIVILGGGTAGWMAANLFAKKWADKDVQITLIESPDIGIVGVGEGSTPTLKRFFEILEIPDADWMPRCNASYKVGIRFEGWSPRSGVESYSHPFFSQVDTFTQNAFLTNCRTRRLGLAVHTQPDDFFLNGVLAQQEKGPQTPNHFPFVTEYGYHFDSGLLGQFLCETAVSQGVTHVQARITEVLQDSLGNIQSLKSDEREHYDGDFFVDCTGFASVLMQKTLGVAFNSYKSNLYNDAAVVMPTPISDQFPAETVSTALSSGWCWRIPLTHRFGNGYVYSSDFISSNDAEQELRSFLGVLDNDIEARHLKMRVGQLEQHWYKNCLGLGLSQGFIEPLEATALLLVQVTVEQFISHYEKGEFGEAYQADFNKDIFQRFERVRDYIVAHYKLNTRDDSDYWRANRENKALSDSLLHILDAWYRREDVSAEISRQAIVSHFGTLSWHCLLSGYGAYPELAENQPNRGDHYQEQGVADFLNRCALNFDPHMDNLARLNKS